MCYRGTLGNSNTGIQRSHAVDESNKSKREETREFWEAAIRLWKDSGLAVREFCRREGLTENVFYSWRRALLAKDAASEESHESSCENSDEVVIDSGRRRKQKQVASGDLPEVPTPFIELVASAPTGACRCMLVFENTNGAKMRIQLRSAAMPDLAAISQSFWNHSS
jgi:transposase-like protein